jgi:hypothetical protein
VRGDQVLDRLHTRALDVVAVADVAHAGLRPDLREKILTDYTWDRAAACIARGYDQIMEAI